MFDWSPINLAKTPSRWTDKRIKTLKELWAQGLSGSAIAAELGEVTRNSVIGKVHRLGLAKRANPTNARATPTRFRKPRVQRFREVMPMAVECDQHVIDRLEHLHPELFEITPGKATGQATLPERPGQVTLMGLTSETCRWPMWTDAAPERLYCGADGADMENKLPYCSRHSRMAYRARAA